MKKDRIRILLQAIAHSACSMITVCGFSRLCTIGNTVRDTAGGGSYDLVDTPFINWIIIVLSFLIVYFESVLFAVNNRAENEKFFHGEEKLLTAKKQLKYLARSPGHITDLLIFIALHIALPVSFCFRDAVLLFNTATETNSIIVKLLMVPALIIANTLGYLSAFRKWISDRKKRSREKRRAVLTVLLLSVAYCISGLMIPAVAAGVYSAIRIAVSFWHIPTLLFVVFTVLFFIKRLKEVISRKKLVRELVKKKAGSGSFAVRRKQLYVSVFFNKSGAIILEKQGKTTVINFIFVPSSKNKLILDSDGSLILARSFILFGNSLFHRLTRIDLITLPDADSVLVVTPQNRNIYYQKDGTITEQRPDNRLDNINIHDLSTLRMFLDLC